MTNYFRTFKSSYRKTFDPIINFMHLNIDKLPPRRKQNAINAKAEELTKQLEGIIFYHNQKGAKFNHRYFDNLISLLNHKLDREFEVISSKDFNFYFNNEFEGEKRTWKENAFKTMNTEDQDFYEKFLRLSTIDVVELLGTVFGLKYGRLSIHERAIKDFFPKPKSQKLSNDHLSVQEYMQLYHVSYSTVMRKIQEGRIKAQKAKNGHWLISK